MKLKIKQLFVLACLLISTLSFGQAPQKFNYQGIARDVKGNPLAKQKMSLKISVLPTQDATVSEYEETQMVTTNEFGLYTLQIGNGTPITGEMKTVKWETGNKYIRIAIDQKGGTDYVDAGTTQLLSVPYAIYADKAGLARETVEGTDKTRTGAVSSNAAHVAGDANYVTKFTALNTIGKSLIYDNGTRVGIGTATPLSSGLLHLQSTVGTQPLILESPQGVHNLIREAGVNRGYFGSYIGSGGAYPTPAGTSDADFDIGTSGASTGKLHFATNTTPRLSIMPTTGNVGIGTTTPTTKLEVAGQVKITGGAPGAGKILTSDATGLATWTTPSITSVGGTTNYLPKYTPNGTTLGNSSIFNDASGNVGIGTATPAAKFDVKTTNSYVSQFNGGSNMYMGIFENDVYRGYLGSYSGDTADVDFGTGSGTTGSTHLTTQAIPRLTVDASGNVGIGTTAPTYKLEVDHGGATGVLVKSTSSFSVIDIDGFSGDAALRFQKAGVGQWNLRNDPSSDNLQIFELGGGGERLQIQNTTGNVGIGNVSPTDKLHVNGGITTGDNATQQGRVTLLPTNGGAFFHMQNANDNTLQISDGPSAGTNGIMTFSAINADRRVGIGTNNPTTTLDVVGQVKISGGTPGLGKVLTSDATGLATWSTPSITSSIGTNNYIPKFSASGTSLVNSSMQDNGTSVSIGLTTPSLIYQAFVYRQQLTANGDGQSTLRGYRTRDSQNDGTDYSQIGVNSATSGYNFWGDVYTYGVTGHSYNDYNRTGGVLGADVNGSYWGSLGYRSSGLVNYGVYGSSAYANGSGYLPTNEVAGIGGGFFGNMVGSISKGKVIGQMNSGELFASYNLGDEYTSGKQIELVDNGTEKVAAYSVTSTELTIYKKGKINLVNGTAFVAFDKNYTSLLADVPVVTITPMGACNGVYIESISKEGFTIKELNNGSSNVNISWISVADRIDNNSERTIPSEVLANSFDTNLQKTMHDDSNKENATQGMWWDGESKNIKFGVMPESTNPKRKVEDLQD